VSLRIDRLSVDIAGRRIVTDISLAAADGQFTGLLGPNGSGKSTILKAIYRVHTPAAGRVLLDRADLLALPARDAARRVAVVAQETASEFDFTAGEMVMIGRTRTSGRSAVTARPTVRPSSGRSSGLAARTWWRAASTRCPGARSNSS